MSIDIVRHAFSVHDYARMRKSGILTEDDRVELIDGEVRTMSPIGPLHAAIVRRLVKRLIELVGDQAIVSPPNPIQLNDYSEPQPDVAILRLRDDNYQRAHPVVGDVLLIIEVSDTTAQYDRIEKLPRYAAAGIPETWIVDVEQCVVEQYTHPVRDQYARLQKYFPGDMITSPVMPAIALNADDLFA
ncbi:Uma2 family endonuclease [Roseiflexus sp.]